MKLTFKTMREHAFNQAVQKLSNYPFKNQKTAYNVMRITKKLEQEGKNGQELFLKMLKQYAKLDDAGNFVPRMDGERAVPDTFVIDDAKVQDFAKAQEDFGETEFEIDWKPIKFEDLEDCRLTAAEIDALSNVLAEPVG